MHNHQNTSLRRPLLAALLLTAGLAACSQPSEEQALRQDYVALKSALEKYARANGTYPTELAQLAEPDRRGRPYVDAARLTDPFGNPYSYDPPRGAKPPVLRSLGSDGVGGGPDDDIDLASMSSAR